jgi:hypothetical protein
LGELIAAVNKKFVELGKQKQITGRAGHCYFLQKEKTRFFELLKIVKSSLTHYFYTAHQK